MFWNKFRRNWTWLGRRFVSLALRALILLTLGLTQQFWEPTRAQELVDEPGPAETRKEVDQVSRIYVTTEMFDRWMFGNGHTASGRRNELYSQLTDRILDVDKMCQITELQRVKLELAGRTDIARLYDQVELVRDKFLRCQGDPQQLNEIFADIRPIQIRLRAGIFNDNSMFAKALRAVLKTEQRANLLIADKERRQFKYDAVVLMAIGMWDEAVSLSDAQRYQLMGLIVRETKPPRAFAHLDYHYVLYQTMAIPEDRFREVLNPQQSRRLQGLFRDFRTILPKLGEMLETHGYEAALDQ